MRGAGGSDGGFGRFFIGLFMIIAGIYLFLDAIYVTNTFAWHSSIYSVGGFGVTPGIILIPFLIGVGMIFYDAENDVGWVLVILTLVFLAVGVISNINFQLRNMSALELLMILGLFVGGIGLFLSSLRSSK